MNRIFYLLSFFVILFNSCKGTKVVTETKVKKLSAEKVISNHYNRFFNFETLNANVRVKYSDEKKSFSPIVSVRMEKDKVIWISAKILGITLAKALITPKKVSYYEKINNTYFEGDFKLLSEWLGTDLDFNKVQQMLLGQTLFNLREDKYVLEIANQKYKLQPKNQLKLFERLFLVNPNNFKMSSQQLKQPTENRNLTIDYLSYQKVGNQDFPEEVAIVALHENNKTTINLEYREVKFNPKVSFPFQIPSGYEQVTIQ